ncbi:hypothetical protein ACTIVE_3717 [Actinomadura verrucosospora]|uniref:Uncharacterized protein n=1 Tax=Actinomadura verrucosospora TaxID=46165 RepID=A0A7D3VT69_ACTVE|nr:hypothetical protein ACTIVE_3717 [Actinomadura verrucosospora]
MGGRRGAFELDVVLVGDVAVGAPPGLGGGGLVLGGVVGERDGPVGDGGARDHGRRGGDGRRFGGGLAGLAAGLDRGALGGGDRGGGLGAAPDAGDDDDLAGLADRGEAAPGAGFGEVAALGEEQFGEPLALDDGPGREPGQHAGRDDVQHVPGGLEGDPGEPQQQDPGHEHAEEHTDLDQRQRHRKPQVVQLVQPLLDAPYVRVRG